MTAPSAEPQQRRVRRRFGPGPIALVPLVLMAVCTLPVAASVRWLQWLPLVPVLASVWALRARVVVADDGLVVCNGLRTRRVAWDDVEGFDVPRHGPVRLLTDGRRTPLTALPRHELPALLHAAEHVAGPAGRA